MTKHRDEPLPTYPVITDEELDRRSVMLLSEVLEYLDALAARDYEGQIKELCDIQYVLLGNFVAMGLDNAPFFREVHRSNMTKDRVAGDQALGTKVSKGPSYQPANIMSVYEKLYVHGFVDDDGTADDTVSLVDDEGVVYSNVVVLP